MRNTEGVQRTARLGPSTDDDSRPPDFFRPATQTLETAASHSRYFRATIHRGRGDLHLQRAARPAFAGAAAALSQAQLQGSARPAVGPDPRRKGQGKTGAA